MENEKTVYVDPELEAIVFEETDIITTSEVKPGTDETPVAPW